MEKNKSTARLMRKHDEKFFFPILPLVFVFIKFWDGEISDWPQWIFSLIDERLNLNFAFSLIIHNQRHLSGDHSCFWLFENRRGATFFVRFRFNIIFIADWFSKIISFIRCCGRARTSSNDAALRIFILTFWSYKEKKSIFPRFVFVDFAFQQPS